MALRDGAILVVVILFLFLGNLRDDADLGARHPALAGRRRARASPPSAARINTMTLGGLTIAIGALVDDAIIDVENVFRRLRQERAKPRGGAPADRSTSCSSASSEVRGAIFFATLIIVLVFLPLFFLPGIEGRLLRPLGFAYIAALAASLLVSLTVTPVLCYLLLPRASAARSATSPGCCARSRRLRAATSTRRSGHRAARARRVGAVLAGRRAVAARSSAAASCRRSTRARSPSAW